MDVDVRMAPHESADSGTSSLPTGIATVNRQPQDMEGSTLPFQHNASSLQAHDSHGEDTEASTSSDKGPLISPPTVETPPSDLNPHARPRRPPPFFSRKRILGPIAKDHADLPLLAACLVTGMIDAAAFRNWGMFIGMQTGNTVILGLSASGLPSNPHAWLTTLVALASFLTGALVAFRLSAAVVGAAAGGVSNNRLWASALFVAQGLILFVSAALATVPGLIPQNPGGTSPGEPDPPEVIQNVRIVSLVPPLAFQAGVQIASSRLLGFNELPVNVLTSTYCDIMGDFKLLALHNVRRDRRVMAVLLLLTGAIASGWMLRSWGGLMSVIWTGGAIKFLSGVGMFCFMPHVEHDDDKGTGS